LGLFYNDRVRLKEIFRIEKGKLRLSFFCLFPLCMKKIFKRLSIGILVLVAAASAGLFLYLRWQSPTYHGEIEMYGLHSKVEVVYDARGVPHIYADNEEDAYLALGYVHAQDRLFQMEMIRRVASGRLAEVLGEDLLPTDKLFRTLGVDEFAEKTAQAYFNSDTAAYQRAALAYLTGVNRFVQFGPTPVEFTLMGIPKTPFETKDVFLAAGFMAFGFAEGFRVDPVLQQLYDTHGAEYVNLFLPRNHPKQAHIPSFPREVSRSHTSHQPLISAIHRAVEAIPIPLFTGSNGWVIGADKSASGFPILANDTHIGFSQPAVWYEAHLEFPGRSFYGHHIAGIPFGLLGNNRYSGWGLTMFENDDVDFFVETLHPTDSLQVQGPDGWEPVRVREEVIKIKGKADDTLRVHITRHGPIINGIVSGVEHDAPVSVWWALTHMPNRFLEGMYRLNHSTSLEEAREAVQLIASPGLNVMYADVDKNIAWWAVAKLPVRPPHVNPRLFLKGSGEDDYRGVHPFANNPQAINPPWGYVYSANNQPDTVNGIFFPGYYFPRDRAGRITQLLEQDKKWTQEEAQAMMRDEYSVVAHEMAQLLAQELSALDEDKAKILANILVQWKGTHGVDEIGPSVYYQLLSQLVYRALGDELGGNLPAIVNTSVMKTALPFLISDESSPWWDDVRTPEKESRKDILLESARTAYQKLRLYGKNPEDWKWGRMHQLTHAHVLGAVKPLDWVFNVGPFEISGGNEVINNLMFPLDTTGRFKVVSGPALRKAVDFANIEGGQTVGPTGQSGNRWSPFYKNQATAFVEGGSFPMRMNEKEIKESATSVLTLVPKPYK
jgi:penicillin G amidase